MRCFHPTAFAVVLALDLVTGVSAQPKKQQDDPARAKILRRLNVEFTKGPAIGQLLPDVTLHTADGKPFPLRSVKGSYTVLVFGCLT